MAAVQDIPSGTLLDNRYLVQSVLGRGGFGRTYLALNQRRWGEPCVLKEFVPTVTDEYVVTKSRELFEREAKTLYKLEHAQIPEFLDVFEEDGRQFLVQQYVEGKNYYQLLRERQQFTPTEVLQWLRDLLPVLEYIHSRNIIHRDISPDNIILPAHHSQPVLIDFGVVKETVTQLFARYTSSGAAQASAVVGKTGYAAPEQLRTGECYPNSDLYSLGVTAVVLLTGNLEPGSLFDSFNEEWRWDQYITLSPDFKAVLDKMMASRPKNRYQTAREVLTDLEALPPAQPVLLLPLVPVSEPGSPALPIKGDELVTEVNLVLQGALAMALTESLPGVAAPPESEAELTTTLEASVAHAVKEAASPEATSLPPTPLSPLPLQINLSFPEPETPISRLPDLPITPVSPLPAQVSIPELVFPEATAVVAPVAGDPQPLGSGPKPLLRFPQKFAIATSLLLGLGATVVAVRSPQIPGLCQPLQNCTSSAETWAQLQPALADYAQHLEPLQDLKTLADLEEGMVKAIAPLNQLTDKALNALSLEELALRLEQTRTVEKLLQQTSLKKLRGLSGNPWLKSQVAAAQQRYQAEVQRTSTLISKIEQKVQAKTPVLNPAPLENIAPPEIYDPGPTFIAPPQRAFSSSPTAQPPSQPAVPTVNCPGNRC